MYSFLPIVFLSALFFCMYVCFKHPSSFGSGTGYNTITSRKSKRIWDYAQKLACDYMRKFLIYSIVYNFVYLIVYFVIKNLEWASSKILVIFNCLVFLSMVLGYFVCVESNLKLGIKQGKCEE